MDLDFLVLRFLPELLEELGKGGMPVVTETRFDSEGLFRFCCWAGCVGATLLFASGEGRGGNGEGGGLSGFCWKR